ncbi:MAG: flagellar hook-basal body protein [Deltaproteobacteria bacterium]|nr:flagellar hook-basal body protein [Deltaproteobacteria bacterium]
MNKDIYTSASGGLVANRRIEILSNNLANVSTVGFKAQRLISRAQSFDETLANALSNMPQNAAANFERAPGVINVGTSTDFSPGPIAETGNGLDVALRTPNHFFAIQTPDGEAYTRAGNFALNADGTLVTQDGLPVSGEGGAISIGQATQPQILANGNVIAAGQIVGRLKTVAIDNLESLSRIGSTRFKISGNGRATAVEADVVPHSLEMPNVSVIEAMVEMISAQRAFEAYTKTVREIDDLNDRAIRSAATRV